VTPKASFAQGCGEIVIMAAGGELQDANHSDYQGSTACLV